VRVERSGCDDHGHFPIAAAQLNATQSDAKRAQGVRRTCTTGLKTAGDGPITNYATALSKKVDYLRHINIRPDHLFSPARDSAAVSMQHDSDLWWLNLLIDWRYWRSPEIFLR
jgi:hypothetical protein